MNKTKGKVFIPWAKRIFFPFMFLIFLIVVMTNLINKGQKHRRISKQIDDRLLDLSLFLAGPRKNKQKKLSYHSFQQGKTKWKDKIQFIKKSLQTKDYIFLFNLSKEDNINAKLRDLKDLSLLSSDQAKIVITEQPERIISNKLKNNGRLIFVEDDLCEPHKQRICTYNPKWPKWFSQFLHSNFYSGSIEKPHITNHVQRIYPSYLLYLSNKQPPESGGKILFMQLNQELNEIPINRSLFWAHVTEMFIDNDFIIVASKNVTILLMLIFIAITAFFIVKFESFKLLFLIFSSYICVIIINPVMINFFRIYIPIWFIFYYGFLSISILFFIRISFLSFVKNRELKSSEQQYERNDLRKTILSIMSHNLNTPLAQVQGLFDLIRVSIDNQSYKLSSLPKLESELSNSYLSIKIFLALTAFNNQRYQLKSIAFMDFIDFLKRDHKLCLQRKPLKLKIYYDQSLLHTQIFCPPLLLVYAIISCLHNLNNASNADLIIAHNNTNNIQDILINIRTVGKVSEEFKKYLDSGKIKPHEINNLSQELSLTFLNELRNKYNLLIMYTQEEHGSSVSMKVSFNEY